MKRKKGKERARRKKGGKEEIEMLAILVFVKVFLAKKKNCWTEKVHLAVTFSIIRLDIYIFSKRFNFNIYIRCSYCNSHEYNLLFSLSISSTLNY